MGPEYNPSPGIIFVSFCETSVFGQRLENLKIMGRQYFRIYSLLLILGMELLSTPGAQGAVIPFHGRIQFRPQEFFIQFEPSPDSAVSFNFKGSQPDIYHLTLNIDHWQRQAWDISSVIECSLSIDQGESGAGRILKGTIDSQYTLLNYQPSRELTGAFELKNNILNLRNITWGGVSGQGSVELGYPAKLDLSLDLKSVDLDQFLLLITNRDDLDASGDVSGRIDITGNTNNPMVKGELKTYNGTVSKLDYNLIAINFKGQYPLLYLQDSLVAQADGYLFNIEGGIDLNQKDQFKKQILALKKTLVVNEDQSNREWTLKRLQTQTTSAQTELKYILRKESEIDPAGKDETDLIGIEKTMSF